MMTGPQHYREALRLFGIAVESEEAPIAVGQVLAEAQDHFAQACAAALALQDGGDHDRRPWRAAVYQDGAI